MMLPQSICSELHMPAHLSHDEYVNAKRRQVADTAQAMLNGELSFLVGSRRLVALRHEVDAGDRDSCFRTFIAIDSETDALPLGEVRKHWSAAALASLETEIQSAEAWAASVGREECSLLIARFGEPE
jgi:hypothetical protein